MSGGKRERSSSEERKEINKHLWSMHHHQASGSTTDRIVEHEGLHADGNDQGYAGSPLHRHELGTPERMGEVVLHEGEGT